MVHFEKPFRRLYVDLGSFDLDTWEKPQQITKFNVMHTICIIYFTLFSLFYSAICTTCRKKHKERLTTSEAKWMRPGKETQLESAFVQGKESKRFLFKSTENYDTNKIHQYGS